MKSQLLKSKSLFKIAKGKLHKLKQLCFKTPTPSFRDVSSVTVSSLSPSPSPSPSPSSSFPDYDQTEVFVNNIGMVEVELITQVTTATLPVYHNHGTEILAAITSNPADEQMNISSSSSSSSSLSSSSPFSSFSSEGSVFQKSTMHPIQFPSNDDGDHQYNIEIPTAATFNPVEEQMLTSSSVSKKKKKSLLSDDVLVLSTIGLGFVFPGMAMCLFLRTYPSSSAPEDGSMFIYSAPTPGHESHFIYLAAPGQKSKFQVPPGLSDCMICSLFFGATLCSLSLIGNLFPKKFAGSSWIVPIVGFFSKLGFLSSIFIMFGLASSMMPEDLMWLPLLCYIILVIAMLALHAVMHFPKLAGRSSAIAWSGKIYTFFLAVGEIYTCKGA